ncbi:alpha/beta hydrolase [Rhodococcus sp. 14-2470-1a]|uniref:alpha/beta hydrolase n=1 Tax=Rhodococcus sp. 14-2470-1a TaxID=2023150 RepID=UPI000B9B9FFC|nr:alpha/beta hydrolase [Rhodococcus sp. 14-2470-1a]OZF44164.1 alpha/beta hydrolase [Rhodococcus sp. 14-2470-1a]
MTGDRYARFLPEKYRPNEQPVSTRWQWRDSDVHIVRAGDAHAPLKVLAVHGAGGHSGALWPFAALAATRGAEVLFPDMPLYGRTAVLDPGSVTYEDWIDMMCDLVLAERRRDPRPLVLFGASMGGMLAYEVAARTGEVADVVATCLLDPSDPQARSAAARFGFLGGPSPALLKLGARLSRRTRLPIRWLIDIDNMSADPELSALCASDPLGGGVSVPLGFLNSFFSFEHTQPQTYRGPRVTLVHPAEDRWTPPEISVRFLERIAADTTLVYLDGCGHFPIEEPGLSQLVSTMEDLARTHGWRS